MSRGNCVFSVETVWEGNRAEGRTYKYHARRSEGFNFVREATDLQGISDDQYDFILSSHNLEHIANPIKALTEWIRVVKPKGAIIILLPDYRRTFDHRRRLTPIEHMLEDYEVGRDERDLTHLDEILERHDLSRDPAAGSRKTSVDARCGISRIAAYIIMSSTSAIVGNYWSRWA
jgi:SAM-dependent methyltransferase